MQGFRWTETGISGERLVRETGPIFGLGVTPHLAFPRLRGVFFRVDGRVTGGLVTYDGLLRTTDGRLIPWRTQTGYRGREIAAEVGLPVRLGRRLRIAPSAGLGVETWHRNLDNGGKRGYDEWFAVRYASAGLSAAYRAGRRLEVFWGITVERPSSLTERLNIASRGQGGPAEVNLSPGIHPRFGADAGIRWSNLLMEVSFDTWTLSRSPMDQGYYQPDSGRRRLTLKAGWVMGT